MPRKRTLRPKANQDVIVSSTFGDVKEHRDALVTISNAAELHDDELAAHDNQLALTLELRDWSSVCVALRNLSGLWIRRNRLASAERCLRIASDVAVLTEDERALVAVGFARFEQLAILAQWEEAECLWATLTSMGPPWHRAYSWNGDADVAYLRALLFRGDLDEHDLIRAERVAVECKNWRTLRRLHALRGAWRLEHGEWALAAASLHEAVAMAHIVHINDVRAETQLVLAKFHLDQLTDARGVAEVLATSRYISRLDLAALWLAIGDGERAKTLALEAYRYAWSDGDPFVARWPLNKSRSLLNQIGVEVPNLPSYDPTKDQQEAWEESVSGAVEELRAHVGRRRNARGDC